MLLIIVNRIMMVVNWKLLKKLLLIMEYLCCLLNLLSAGIAGLICCSILFNGRATPFYSILPSNIGVLCFIQLLLQIQYAKLTIGSFAKLTVIHFKLLNLL